LTRGQKGINDNKQLEIHHVSDIDDDIDIKTKVRLPTASNYQIKIFEAVEKAVNTIIDGKQPRSMIIDAKPGSGKTTTGVAATRLIPAELSTIFVAFNKKIADELASRLPLGIPAKTFHAHWLRQWGQHCWNMHRQSAQVNYFKVKNAVEKHLGISRFQRKKKNMTQEQVEAQRKLREMADDICFLVEKAKIFGVVPNGYPGAESVTGYGDNEYFWAHIMSYFNYQIDDDRLEDTIEVAREILWEGLDNELEIDFNDMLYMPAVKQINGENYQVVMIDEAQDLNSLQRYLLNQMVAPGGMIIAIGDKRQCQPAGTMVSIPGEYTGSRNIQVVPKQVQIENLKIGDKLVSYATKKSSFTGITQQSGCVVEDIASRLYTGDLYYITVGGNTTRATDNHKWLVRFNKDAEKAHAVYLMRKGNHFRVGTAKLLHRRSFGPGQRARDEKADAVYVLCVCPSAKLALDAERMITHVHHIPDVCFESERLLGVLSKRLPCINNGYSHDFWRMYPENYEKGVELLGKFGRNIEYPLWIKGEERHIGRYSFITQSCNLIDDVMCMKTFNGTVHGGEWSPIKISKKYVANEMVYSLRVTSLHDNEHRRLYVADGIVTHNSIYAFRGADAESMWNIQEEFECEEYPLSISYRCAKSIVNLAYEIYPEIEAHPDAPDGSVERPDKWKVEDFKPGHLIICRNNAPTITLAYKLIKHRIPAKVLGRDIGEGLMKLVRKLDADGTLLELMGRVVDWKEHQIALIHRKDPDDVRGKEAIMDKYDCISMLCSNPEIKTVTDLLGVIDQMFTSAAEEKTAVSDSRVTLSTIHKIKGAEADTVFILDSHLINPPWVRNDWQFVQEENLRFVAITRAKTRLVFINSDRIE
jgi:superfamily I DNA/RNA helicase